MGIDLTFCELREKEVVNIVDGRRLGRILDIAFTANGKIVGIIVPGERRFFKNVTGGESIFVAWKNIVKIGEDAILVELTGACGMPKEHDNHKSYCCEYEIIDN